MISLATACGVLFWKITLENHDGYAFHESDLIFLKTNIVGAICLRTSRSRKICKQGMNCLALRQRWHIAHIFCVLWTRTGTTTAGTSMPTRSRIRTIGMPRIAWCLETMGVLPDFGSGVCLECLVSSRQAFVRLLRFGSKELNIWWCE